MNAGLPGTGIGGVFYLLSALWMPFHELYKTFGKKNQPRRLRLILSQVSLALGIIAGIWLTGWLLGELLVAKREWFLSKPNGVVTAPGALPNVIKVTMIFLTIGLLMMVVGGVHILKLVMRHRSPRHTLAGRAHSSVTFNSQVSHSERSNRRGVMVEEVDAVC